MCILSFDNLSILSDYYVQGMERMDGCFHVLLDYILRKFHSYFTYSFVYTVFFINYACLSFDSLGAVGGSIWHFIKGYRNAPKQARIRGGLVAARMRSPMIGGNFGVWGGLFSVFDCSMAYYRKTEDAWNAIISGGLTGGVLAARAGPKAMVRNAIGGAIILAIIEGTMMVVTKSIMKLQMSQMGGQGNVVVDKLEPPVPPGYGTKLVTGEVLELR